MSEVAHMSVFPARFVRFCALKRDFYEHSPLSWSVAPSNNYISLLFYFTFNATHHIRKSPCDRRNCDDGARKRALSHQVKVSSSVVGAKPMQKDSLVHW